MANIKISALPAKRLLDLQDLLPIVDTQFGSNNYISKHTSFADLLESIRNSGFGTQYVVSVNGKTGAITLYLRTLTDTEILEPADKDVLIYNENAASCGCCRWQNTGIIDSGVIRPRPPVMRATAPTAAFMAPVSAPKLPSSAPTNAVYSVNGKTGVVRLGVADMADAAITTDPQAASGDTLIYFGGTAKWTNTGFINGGVVTAILNIVSANRVTSVNSINGNVLLGVADLLDVALNNSAEKDILAYDSATARWQNSEVVDGKTVSPSLMLLTENLDPILTDALAELLI